MTEADGTELMESQRAHCVNPANSTSSTRLPLKDSRDHRTTTGLTEEKKEKILFLSKPACCLFNNSKSMIC